REVRRERTLFGRKAERRELLVDGVGEGREILRRLHPAPDNTGPLLNRKVSDVAKMQPNFYWRPDAGERRPNRIELRRIDVADEFQSDGEILRPYPLRFFGRSLH